MRIQQCQNLNVCLQFITNHEVKMTNIGAEDIVDGNFKIILGLIWLCILKWDVDDISEDELSARDALLLWCKKKTKDYNGVEVTNFHTSWKDGLGFCALIHKHKPGLLDFHSLDPSDHAGNLEKAFQVAEDLGIPRFLDVEDIVESDRPDEKSMVTYLTQWYKYFSAGDKGENAARRIGNLIDFKKAMDKMQAQYTMQAQEFMAWTKAKTEELSDAESARGGNTLEGVEGEIAKSRTFAKQEKPPKAGEKVELEALLATIQLKLKGASRSPYVPEAGCGAGDINSAWAGLNDAEKTRNATLKSELRRQKEIRDLVERFNRKASKLEAWNGAKSQYCATAEQIDTLPAAQTKVKVHAAYLKEFESSNAGLDEVKAIGARIVELDYISASTVSERCDSITGSWATLREAGLEKQKVLNKDLAREERKDALRKQFAQLALETKAWYKSATVGVNATGFGNTLSAVRAYKQTIDAEDAATCSNAEQKKAAIVALDAELKANNVNDNQYTVITLDDVDKYEAKLNEAIAARTAAWEKQLQHQEALEELRLKFAQVAQTFADQVEAQTTEVDGMTGEPDEVIAMLPVEPLRAELQGAVTLEAECLGRGITSNEHTQHTVAKLQSLLKQLDIYIKNKKSALNEEKRMKAQYHLRAKQLMAWIEANCATLPDTSALDNTLATAQKVVQEFKAWKVSEKASNVALKADVLAVKNSIDTTIAQSKFNRPAFAPEAGCSADELSAAWNKLVELENARESTLSAELARQEQLASLVRRFNNDAEELTAFVEAREAFFAQEETVDSLTAAQVQMTTLSATLKEVEAKQVRREALSELRAEIATLNYVEQATVDASCEAIVSRFDALPQQASTKQAVLEEALAAEQKKEEARVNYAKLASEFLLWVRDACDTVSDHVFGSDLAAVQAYQAVMDEDSAKVTADGEALRSGVTAADEAQKSLGVVANIHTTVTAEQIEQEHSEVATAVAARAQAYTTELARQEAMEAKRKEFAAAAATFVELLAAATATLEGVEQGDTKADKLNAAWQEGTPIANELVKVQQVDGEAKAMGISENVHASSTVEDLALSLEVYNNLARSLLSDAEEETDMKARAASQAAEAAARSEAEARALRFSEAERELSMWCDDADENVAENLDACETSESLQVQKELYEKTLSSKGEKVEAFEALKTAAAEGSFDVEAVSAKFNATIEVLDARGAAVADAEARLASNEALRAEYSSSAEKLSAYMTEQTQTLAADSGSLDDQLSAAEAQSETVTASTTELLEAVETANNSLEEKHLTVDGAVSVEALRAEVKQLVDGVMKKIAALRSEIQRLKGTEVSEEQMVEFREVFAHFDKDKSGSLQPLEFRGCLQSMGQDPTDEDVAAIMKTLDADNSGCVSFDEFLSYMVSITKDHDSEDEIIAAFRVITSDGDFITEQQMRSVMDGAQIDYLIKAMPVFEGVDNAYDYKSWANSCF